MSEFSLETTTLGDVRELLLEETENDFQKRLQDLREEFKEHGKIYLSLDDQNRLIVIGKRNYNNNDIIKIKKSVGQVDFLIAAICGEVKAGVEYCDKYYKLTGCGISTLQANVARFYSGMRREQGRDAAGKFTNYGDIVSKFDILTPETTLGELRTYILSNDANGLQLDEDQKKILLYIGKRLFGED